jgi:hypothetical protein
MKTIDRSILSFFSRHWWQTAKEFQRKKEGTLFELLNAEAQGREAIVSMRNSFLRWRCYKIPDSRLSGENLLCNVFLRPGQLCL